MTYIHINQARLFYQIYSPQLADRLPILLIHGFPSTGENDWREVAPLLARHNPVIVPDCRGHGQSENPDHTYSFHQMAADVTALVQALGYERAHLIGHSNGGNVALVAALEHPEIIQTAVLQAANAYVSDDLVEKEPLVLDPDRVLRENPALVDLMNSLHAPTHGPDYWQELLRLGVAEIISQPNYTPQDLATVRCPTLVIQGEKDRVNAPSRHAQHIAEHIPDAELWLPPNVGHTIHQEQPLEWLKRIEDFLNRRGDPVNDALYRMKQRFYGDQRQTIFEVRAEQRAGSPGTGEPRISGRVLQQEQVQKLDDFLNNRPQMSTLPLMKDITVLLDEHTPWALVNRAVTDVRREPSILAERVNQALLGESLRILEGNGDWVRVRLELDGYLGWVQSAALYRCSENQVREYQHSRNGLIVAELNQASISEANGDPSSRAGVLPFGITIPVVERSGERTAVGLPDGRIWWLDSAALMPTTMRPVPDEEGIAHTLQLIRRFIGVPYLWGGRSPFGYDCSGFAQTFLAYMGIQAPRDADQQFEAGAPVSSAALPGDLYFFGSDSESARRKITHVAISLGGGEMIHANGSAWGVSYNSLEAGHPLYSAWLKENLVGIGRFR